MADTMKNLGKIAGDSRSRTIIILTTVVIAIAVGAAYFTLRARTSTQAGASRIAGIPSGIKSIPGSKDTTPQYVKLQTEENIQQAKSALKRGGSFIPTIVGQETLGKGAGQRPVSTGGEGVGFTTLAQQQEAGGIPKGLWFVNLKQANCSIESIKKARDTGVSLSDIKSVCSCQRMSESDISLDQLQNVCACPELKKLGYKAKQFKDIGYNATRLKACGYSACELRAAGFTAQELKDAGFTDDELRGAGFSPADIRAATGLPPGITPEDIRKAGCGVDALRRLRQEGVSAYAIRHYSGCTAAQMKAAGYTAKELKAAGFTAAELRKAGFSAAQLRAAGFSPAELKAAGFPPKGMSPDDIKNAGCSADALKKEREQGVSAEVIRKYAGCSVAELNAAGFKVPETARQSALDELSKDGCTVAALRKARAAGVSARTIRVKFGCSASQMKAAGFTAKELKDAGFTAAELRKAGFTAAQLKAAGFTAKQLKDAGFTAAQLRAAGFSAKQLRAAGFTAKQLKAAGFSAKDLKDAGFTAKQLRAAGFSAKDLKDAGFTPQELKDAGYTAQQLKDAGFSAAQLRKAGFSARQLADAGFSPSALQAAGFTPNQLRAAGVTKPVVAQPTDAASQLKKIMERQAKQMSKQQYQQALQTAQSGMQSNSSQLLSTWNASVSQVYIAGTPPAEKDQAANGAAAAGSAAGKDGQASASDDMGGPVIKAGTIMFAVLDTAVNSDEPGPVLATIVQGELKGAKLIGSMTVAANAEKGTIKFNQMTLHNVTHTMSINAFAIDPNTARTALASHVDNHYLLRYGSLFASSFLEGVGQSVQQEGTAISTNGSSTTVTNKDLSTFQNIVVGLGKVGQTWGAQIAPNFARRPTISIYSGSSMGILFISDATLPPEVALAHHHHHYH